MNHVRTAIVTLGALSVAIALTAIAGFGPLRWLTWEPLDLGQLLWPAVGGFAVLLFFLQQQGFVFHWRDQSTKISLDEVGIFVALLVIPAAPVVLAIAAAAVANQAVHQRAWSKASFNVGQYALAGLVTVAACSALRAVGVPTPWYAVVSPLLFYALTAFQVSMLFAELDREPVWRVFGQRFTNFVLVGSALGVSLGLVVVALFLLHPLAVLAAVPVFAYLRRFGRLSEWADDEIATHRLVASVSVEMAGRDNLDHVAHRILTTCHHLFDCGEASLTIAAPEGEPRVWRREFGRSEGVGGVVAEIIGARGVRLGTLSAFPKPGQTHYGEREQQLLRTVGASAAAAAANAEALRISREANESLAASEERYRSLFETAHVLIHVLDSNGHIVDANPASLSCLGWETSRIRGRPFTDLLVTEDAAELVGRLKGAGEVIGIETRMRAADGRRVDVLLDARRLADDEDRYVVFTRDITQLKELEGELRMSMSQQHETIKRLENMNRELEQFTLWTTHDMREPLRSIGTIASFLHEDIGSIEDEEARDLARRICEGSDRLKERVKALHAFSLIVQRDEDFEDVDMQNVIEHIIASLETKIHEKRATIVLPKSRFPTIRAQAHRIDQVFGNLIENALKYGREEGGMVELGFTQTADEVRFYVRDDGPGIGPSYHDRIFQLFQRGPGAIESGSGAGLAIVRRIAEQHGGRAWVESTVGEGSCFLVALPRPTPLLQLRKAF